MVSESGRAKYEGLLWIVVYTDDFVVCFQYKAEAEQFYEALKRRMEHFGLRLEEDKSRLLEFGRFAEDNRQKTGKGKPETFNFLGFTHYCSKSRNGKFRVKRKTSRKKFVKKCQEVHQRLKEIRVLPVADIVRKLNQILAGYFHYYGITDNMESLENFCYVVRKSLFFWLNRRSEIRSYSWDSFNAVLMKYPMNRPKIYVSIYG